MTKLLNKVLRTHKLNDLKRYLDQGGKPDATVFLAVARSGQWFVDPSDYLGEGDLDPASLMARFCWNGNKPLVLALLKAGANVDGNGTGTTPLIGAALGGNLDGIRLLLSLGAEIDRNNGRGTALGAACDKGHLAAAKLLVAEGADVHSTGFFADNKVAFMTPIMSAAKGGHIDVMQFLREKGASFESRSEGKQISALHMAIEFQAPTEASSG